LIDYPFFSSFTSRRSIIEEAQKSFVASNGAPAAASAPPVDKAGDGEFSADVPE